MSPLLIHCTPHGICSWNFHLSGNGRRADTRIHTFSEQGIIDLDGRVLSVVKHGPASGRWTLEDHGRVLLTAQKPNPFTRTFTISGDDGTAAELRANSALARPMILRGPGTNCRIEPAHAFTRRASITGRCPDFPLACFAFWLTVVTWRRAAAASS